MFILTTLIYVNAKIKAFPNSVSCFSDLCVNRVERLNKLLSHHIFFQLHDARFTEAE